MKSVFSSTESQVGLFKHILKEAGIESELRSKPERFYGTPIPELWVNDDDYSTAMEILDNWQHPDPSAPPPWTCSKCGEPQDALFETCWKCGAPRLTAPKLLCQGGNLAWVQRCLKKSGMDSVIRYGMKQFMRGGFGRGGEPIPYELFVNEKDYPAALEILKELQKPVELEKGEPWKCPRCGENVEAEFGACWQCGTLHPGYDVNP